jgi:hypothetical protein
VSAVRSAAIQASVSITIESPRRALSACWGPGALTGQGLGLIEVTLPPSSLGEVVEHEAAQEEVAVLAAQLERGLTRLRARGY